MSCKKIAFVILLYLMSLTALCAHDIGGDTIKIKINDELLNVRLENNEATDELVKTLEKGNVTVSACEYGGFEKVGNLGFSLPSSDEYVDTDAGDIVLYQGNQISLFYDSHSWSYTKIGKIENVTSEHLTEILGSGDVSIVLSLE